MGMNKAWLSSAAMRRTCSHANRSSQLKKMTDQKIHRLIAEYKIEQAFEGLFSLVNKINYQNSHDKNKEALILLSARFHDLMHQKLIGVISNSEAILESNKIVNGILQVNKTLLKSKEYQSQASSNDEEDKEFKLIVDTSNCDVQNELRCWGTYNTSRKFENIKVDIQLKEISWHIIAEHDELVGANRALNLTKGKITYEYLPIKFNKVKDNLLFFIIPMKSNKDLIEVGTNISDDPSNGYSPFRIRKLANPILNTWHKDEILFDFSSTPEAKCSVFAFRINEGTPRPNEGIMEVRNIKIYEMTSK